MNMRHLLLLACLVVAVYAVWQVVPKAERDDGLKLIAHHGIRIGALVALLVALVALAYYATSTRLL